MRKLAHIFTDLLLGPAPTQTGTGSPGHPHPASPRRHERVAEVVVVDHPDDHLHDVLARFPAEGATLPAGQAPPRPRRSVKR
ncbi:hypothetical protein TBR22_A23500 [Luteitalea sp. TBR-22]|uniref:hypothetical protein n=1 Tax=Luteitalea sp. TBR-22 TaxID=2802971 RepID=UPI001AFCCE5B|nr:hypothetical protein [Luteitalea sp. TBR-22]BCS33123.1 hypothetical protein TBR22_A23500 [Luteitalea sp. TBR-22]